MLGTGTTAALDLSWQPEKLHIPPRPNSRCNPHSTYTSAFTSSVKIRTNDGPCPTEEEEQIFSPESKAKAQVQASKYQKQPNRRRKLVSPPFRSLSHPIERSYRTRTFPPTLLTFPQVSKPHPLPKLPPPRPNLQTQFPRRRHRIQISTLLCLHRTNPSKPRSARHRLFPHSQDIHAYHRENNPRPRNGRYLAC